MSCLDEPILLVPRPLVQQLFNYRLMDGALYDKSFCPHLVVNLRQMHEISDLQFPFKEQAMSPDYISKSFLF
jgi:hypothetical protein